MFKRFFTVLIALGLLAVVALIGATPSSASGSPSGQRMFGNTSYSTATGRFTGGGGTVEPAYDLANGSTVYLLTPNNAKTHPNAHNVAPLYLPVYPVGAGLDPSTLNCAHVPADNCPDHGPGVAGAAMTIAPGVYGGGVLGHDHLVGVASTGGDFNVIWEPVLLLFTNSAAARQHITTMDQIQKAEAAGNAFEVPLPQLDFNCSIVSGSTYAHASPAPTVVGP